MFDDDFRIKKKERMNPWHTPINMNTDKALILVVVFINQM
jgi:hypothetical protein